LPIANLSVRIPESTWIGSVSRDRPGTTFRVLSVSITGGEGRGVVEVRASDGLHRILDEIPDCEDVSETEVLWFEDENALLRFRTRKPLILQAARHSGVPVPTPFDIKKGTGEWKLAAPRDRLGKLNDTFDSMGIDHDIEYVHKTMPGEVLTDRQREVVEKALEMGYYDTPREATLSDLSDELSIAKSTCSEVVHRAEERLVKRFWRGCSVP